MLRVLPWITDGALEFLDNYLATNSVKKQLTIFEYGCGNSTLYYLSRGCRVASVDHDEKWAERIRETAKCFGYSHNLTLTSHARPYCSQYDQRSYDIVSIDGRDRVACLEHVIRVGLAPGALVVLDNTERIAGGPYAEYIKLLSQFAVIHFEQPRLRGVDSAKATYYDRAGQHVGHRWITSIAFKPHGGGITTLGFDL